MSLAGEITKYQEEMAGKIPDNLLQLLGEKTKELIASGLVEKALAKGDKIPAFELPNVSGKSVSSAQLLEQGPLVISFYRGSWCPYCNLESARAPAGIAPDSSGGRAAGRHFAGAA